MAPIPPTASSKYRPHLPSVLRDPQPQDPGALPEPPFFESLDEFYSYADCRNSDQQRENLIKVKLESDPGYYRPSAFNRKRSKPQLLICHDFQGGYNEKADSRGYTFEHWHLADIFVYFSHKRISPPPQDWIKAAHRHGTKILGTVIFEWKESIPDLALLLRGPSVSSLPYNKEEPDFSPYFAHSLIDLAISRSFSGYLINIEVSLSLGFSCSGEHWPPWVGEIPRRNEMKRNCKRLREWLRFLREEGRKRFKDLGKDENEWEIIWYDSVTYDDGELQWQDALTNKNKDWLEVTDGIFTNYTWARPLDTLPPGSYPSPNYGFTGPKEDGGFHPALRHSCKVVDEIKREREDVFVGIDVFGRNCYGGLQSWKSLEMIGTDKKGREKWNITTKEEDHEDVHLGLSVALFAQGWTWENNEPNPNGREWRSWFKEDTTFFQDGDESNSYRPISRYFKSRPPPRLSSSSSDLNLVYLTNFTLGSGFRWFSEGQCIKDWTKEKPLKEQDGKLTLPGWTDLSVIQPKADCISRASNEAFHTEMVEGDAWYGGVSIKVKSQTSASSSGTTSRLLSLSTISIPKYSESRIVIASMIIKGRENFDPSRINPVLLDGKRILFDSKQQTQTQTLTNGWIEIRSELKGRAEYPTYILHSAHVEEIPKGPKVGEFGILFEKDGMDMEFLIGELRLECSD